MVLVATLCLVPAGLCPAEGAGPVELSVNVIYADNSDRGVDSRLAVLERQLQTTFRYTTYQLMGSHNQFLAMGQPGHVALPGGKLLVLVPQGISGGAVVLLVSIQQGGQVLLNSQLKLANRGTILVGGPVHEAGVLILAIGATIP